MKRDLLGYAHPVIENLLGVSNAFIRKWRNQYARYGIQRLYVQYHGSQGSLSPQERAEVIAFLNTHEYDSVEA